MENRSWVATGNGGDAGPGGGMMVRATASDEGQGSEHHQDHNDDGGRPPVPLSVLHGMERLFAGTVGAELGGHRSDARATGLVGPAVRSGSVEAQLALGGERLTGIPSESEPRHRLGYRHRGRRHRVGGVPSGDVDRR